MKRLIMLATFLVMLAVMVPPVSATEQQASTVAAQSVTTNLPPASHPVTHPTTVQAAKPKRMGFFAKLWDLEKRKNAAIRRMLGWE